MKKGGWSQHAFYILGVSWEITFCDNGIYEQLVIDQWLEHQARHEATSQYSEKACNDAYRSLPPHAHEQWLCFS